MIVAALLLATAPMTAVDAERAFAADAARLGQWTAFRKWSTDDAIMNPPEWVKARDWLKERADPPRSVQWQLIASYMSCDGETAINTGAWQQPDGRFGYFTTVWRRQPDKTWKWQIDFGDTLATARPVAQLPLVRKATCPKRPLPLSRIGYRFGGSADGGSADGTLQYHWWQPGFDFHAEIWNGKNFDRVIVNHIAPRSAQ